MGKKNLGTAAAVTSMVRQNSVIIEVGGSIRRIALEDFIEAINKGNREFLLSSAWGVPLKQNQSSPDWGLVGNVDLFLAYRYGGGRYLVTSDGKAAKLSIYDSSVYADGTPLDETKGNVMVVFPDLYYKVERRSEYDILWMSPLPISEFCIKRPVIGAYKGSIAGSGSSSKLVSRSGVVPANNKTISEFWAAAQKNSTNWGITSYEHRKFMMMLGLSLEGAGLTNSYKRTTWHGVTGSNGEMGNSARSLLTGATQEYGDAEIAIPFTWLKDNGEQVVNAQRISLCGIEDPFGWMNEMIQGIYCGSSDNQEQDGTEVFIYQGNRIPTSAELTTHPSGQYETVTRLTTNGFIKEEIIGDEFDLIPKVTGGDGVGSSSYWCDQTFSGANGQLVLWGGNAGHRAGAGLAFLDINNGFGLSSQNISARLAYYGDLQFVEGADIARN